MLDSYMRFRVVVVSFMIQHQRWRGNFRGTVARSETKCSLNVMMEFSSSFVWFMIGEMRCIVILFMRKYCLDIVGHLLSMMWFLGFINIFSKCL